MFEKFRNRRKGKKNPFGKDDEKRSRDWKRERRNNSKKKRGDRFIERHEDDE